MRYKPIYNSEMLLLGEGHHIIVTGWTPAKLVASSLKKRGVSYASVGNLYNPNYGLTPLIANLLLHAERFPVHALSCTKQDKLSRSSEALHQLLCGNYIREGQRWVVLGTDDTPIGEVDGEISKEELQSLVGSSKLWKDPSSFYKYMEDLCPSTLPIRNVAPKLYEFKAQESERLPGPQSGLIVNGETIFSCWVKALHAVYKTGMEIENRREILNVMSVIQNEPDEMCVNEWMPTSKETVEAYCAQVLTAAPSPEGSYSYGSRLRRAEADSNLDIEAARYLDQLTEIISKLAADPSTNRAVMTTWVPKLDLDSEQPPCLNQIQIKVVDKRVTLSAVFRSHDMYTAYCSNLFALKAIQQAVVAGINEINDELQVTRGELICVSQAAHIYEWCLDKTAEVILHNYNKEAERYADPVGNYVISLEEGFLNIRWMSSKGRFIKKYAYNLLHAVKPLNVCRDIAADSPTIQPTHLSYIATELCKALICHELNTVYTQDQGTP
jgi:thymidylate synthase